MLNIKPKMISDDEANHTFLCGKIWREYLAGKEVIVVTEHKICPTNLFGNYYAVIKIGIDKGLVKLLTLSQVEAEHFDKCLVEF